MTYAPLNGNGFCVTILTNAFDGRHGGFKPTLNDGAIHVRPICDNDR